MSISLRILGPFEADVADAAADLGGPRQRAVLALLLVARGAPVSVDRLIEDLWRGEPPARALGALQVYVSNLRRVLEPDRAPRAPAGVLVSAPPGYAVRLADEDVDAWQFEHLVRTAGAETEPARAADLLQRALDLWRGDAFGEFAGEPWAESEAARLEELYQVAREQLLDALVRGGRAGEAVVDAEQLVREAPLREEGWRLLALAQYVAGRQGEALATLRRARATLSDELGVDPGPRLTDLERDVRAQTVEVPTTAPVQPVQVVPDAAVRSRFVGRLSERAALLTAATQARPGTPAVALVAGEAGGGKSALLTQLRDDLRAGDWRIAVGRCPESESGPPAWAWSEVVRGLAAERDPGALAAPLTVLLDDTVPLRSGDALDDRFRLHRAVRDWLSTLDDRPLAVLLDDAHRADAETRALLMSLLDQGLANRVLFVVAYRPDADPGLDELLATLARHSPTRLALSGFDESEAAALIEVVTGRAADPSVVAALAARTDGNPFYLKESAQLLASEGELVATSQVPAGVADVLRRRLARLPDETVTVLRLAAVIGRNVDVALLISAAESDEETVLDALEAGLISGLLLEPGPGAVRFSHLLVRETLYLGITGVRRVRWHARVADAIAALYPNDLTALAHHSASSATSATARDAAQRCLDAAELARSRFAFDAEAQAYAEAQRCLGLEAEPDVATVVDVMARRVDALIRYGNTNVAIDVRNAAVELARAHPDVAVLARAVNAPTVPALRGTLRTYAYSDPHMITTIEGLLASGELDDLERARTLCTLIRETSSVDDPRCRVAIAEALELTARLGDPSLRGIAVWSASEEICADLHADEREQIVVLGEVLAAQHPEPIFRIAAHLNAINSAAVRLDLTTAREHTAQIRNIARTFQLRQGEFQADVLTAMQDFMGGDLAAADAGFTAAYDTQLSRGTVDAGAARLLALTGVRYAQGRLDELVPELAYAYEHVLPHVGNMYSLALAAAGDHDRARRVLAGTPALLEDYLWLVFATMRGLTVATIGDRDAAPAAYDALLPFTDRLAGAGTNGFTIAPVALASARLAVLLGRTDAARAHVEQARTVALKLGSAPWLAMADDALVSR